MKIALHAFKCLKRHLPPKKVQDYPFWCGLHSFLAHVKAVIDSLTEEINLLYEIAPQPETKRWRMSIDSLQREENMRRLKRSNHKLFTEISTATKANWFMDLKKLRDEEAIHGALSGKKWHAVLGGDSPTITVGIMGVPDLATWCPDVLKETNKFLERCYKQM